MFVDTFLDLIPLLEKHESVLLESVLGYALRFGYTEHTSTLVEAWRLSISGLTGALCQTIRSSPLDFPYYQAGTDFQHDPMALFGVIEARRHRSRGIDLGAFLGLFKYYREAYLDSLRRLVEDADTASRYARYVTLCCDRIELAFCTEWTSLKEDAKLDELRAANILLANEKNKYLTLFESIQNPIILTDNDNRIDNINKAGLLLFEQSRENGFLYYNDELSLCLTDKQAGNVYDFKGRPICDLLPWLQPALRPLDIYRADQNHCMAFGVRNAQRPRDIYDITIFTMRDLSQKFSGKVILFENATEIKRMEKRLQYMAETDQLTGITNKSTIEDMLSRELARISRTNAPFSLIIYDVDHFKAINDTYGHQVGDKVLAGLARTVKRHIRSTDAIGRWGGEEFIILLPETPLASAVILADKLRVLIEKTASIDRHKVTCSFGVTQWRAADSADTLIKRADDAMYQAKKNGRNCTFSM